MNSFNLKVERHDDLIFHLELQVNNEGSKKMSLKQTLLNSNLEKADEGEDKLLSWKIGFKALDLETGLQQLWAREGIIDLVGIGNDFSL